MPHATSLRLPPNPKVEIEFTAGVWTDVTADIDQGVAPVSVHYGRSSEFSTPQVAEFSAALRNNAGNYTPRNQASPYWPNVQPRKRIRYSYNPGTQRMRFTGYISQWQPLMVDGWRPVMAISATDRMSQLSRVTMQSPLMTEYLADGPVAFWPLTDASADTAAAQQALDVSGSGQPPFRVSSQAQAALSFGDNGPGYGDGSGVRFAPSSTSAGQFLDVNQVQLSVAAFTLELWVNAGLALPAWVTGQNVETILRWVRRSDLAFDGSIRVSATGRPYVHLGSAIITGPKSIVDGRWHHIAITRSSSGGNLTFWVDGVSAGSAAGTPAVTNPDYIALAVDASSTNRFQGNLGYIAVYSSALSSGRIAGHYQAGNGYYGDTSDARIQRFLGIAGLTSADWNLDAGQITVNHYPQGGQDVASACQDIAASEGGGAVFYVTPDGKVRFVNRRYRDNRTPALTLNAVDDLDGSTYSPSMDDVTLVNQVTANRSAESGTLTAQTAQDSASITQYGVSATTVTTYTTSDADALNLAQYEVSSQAWPDLRYPQIAVDLATAGHDLYDAVGQLQIGARIRLGNIPAAAYPLASLDFFLEGWAETATVDSYMVVFDVTAADNPPRWKWDTSGWSPQAGTATLTAGIANNATSLQITTTGGQPTFTTNAGSYPLTIRIGEEHIRLNTAPSGSTSPQSFTGVTRGVDSTPPAQQLTGASITLAPADAWSL